MSASGQRLLGVPREQTVGIDHGHAPTLSNKQRGSSKHTTNKTLRAWRFNFGLTRGRDKISEAARDLAIRCAASNPNHGAIHMVEATNILELQLLGARKTLARASACKAVKDEFKAKGMKISGFSGREISLAADSYLTRHPELLVEASHFGRVGLHLIKLFIVGAVRAFDVGI